MQYKIVCDTPEATQQVAATIGTQVKGGELVAFSSDVGGGKTTFVKGLAKGMGVTGVVQSPTFTISFIHKAAHGRELHHFDFYRLTEPGIMRAELAESLYQPNAVVAIEWGDIVHDILPAHVIKVHIATSPKNETRLLTIDVPEKYHAINQALEQYRQGQFA